MHKINRRTFVAAASALAMGPVVAAGAAKPAARTFPQGFLWGAATAGHQVEGNNIGSDLWVLENTEPTVFAERSGDAVNNFELWPVDLDLVRDLGLNTYRFSLEWSRIEPEPGVFSLAMLDHYKAIIEGCRARRLTPMVSFNHFTTPRWFAAQGGWANPSSPSLFARYCDRAMRHLGQLIGYATTLNEPNMVKLMQGLFPQSFLDVQRKMLGAAARANQSEQYMTVVLTNPEDADRVGRNLLAAHKAGKTAIKAVRSELPVGVTLAITDDQAVGSGSVRDARRADMYGEWLEAAKEDDFVGVQNYARALWDSKGMVAAPAGGPRNFMGQEVYAPSLAGAVRYVHAATRVPVIVTEHGVGTDDDSVRAAFIPAALSELQKAIAEGVPVNGYVHWSLLDNFEWIFGFKPRFGLCSVDRTTFERTPKPSASVLSSIARRNAI